MKIVEEQPPIYGELVKWLGREPKEAVMTFGDILYNPFKHPIPFYILEHEQVHAEQQGEAPQKWWDRYLKDTDFRLDQEAKAYGKQYKEMIRITKDRNVQARMLINVATALSGKLYGECIGLQDAMKLIKEYGV